MEVFLIRHGSLAIDKGICYGQSDIGVDKEKFEAETKAVQELLPDDIEQAYSSPLSRCTDLASALFQNFEIDERLMELNFGDWENKKWDEIPSSDLEPWMNDFVQCQVPNGESYEYLFNRNKDFLESLLETSHKKAALVTHAGNIRSILSYILDLPLENSFRIHLNYTAVVHIQLKKDKNLCKLISIK